MKSNRIRRTALPLGLAGVMAVAIASGGFSANAVAKDYLTQAGILK